MQKATVWIDHQKAYILEYKPQGASIRTFHIEDINEHSKDYVRKFYHNLALELKSCSKVVIFGPGMAKEEFRNHCEDHHPQLAHAILDVLPMKAHPSNAEIMRASNDFYDRHMNWVGIG